MIPHPTTVEHVGDTLTVNSPGGFIGSVEPGNIITHPAVPRYKSLAHTMARLGLAEREGVGVDRMVGDMLRVGKPAPVFSEVAGPYVRVVLFGGPPDPAVVDLAASLASGRADTIDTLLIVEHLTRRGWVDIETAATVLQRPQKEAEQAIRQLEEATLEPGGAASGGAAYGTLPGWGMLSSGGVREVAGEILKQASWMPHRPHIVHWRNHDGFEVDIVAENGRDGSVVGIEVKADSRIHTRDRRGLRELRDTLGERFTLGVVLHTGPHSIRYHHTTDERIIALPVERLWTTTTPP